MDKFGVLVTSPIASVKNIGDYIQSLAALQFVPEEAEIEFIEKENISEYSSPNPIKVIMNAWYMWRPENWPPKDKAINPLLTSMHLSPLKVEAMLKGGGSEYLRKFGPVGCRDTGTMEILNKYGISNYFSGCLTLTLGESFQHHPISSQIFFVDPFFPPIRYVNEKGTRYDLRNIIRSLVYFISSPRIIHTLTKKDFFRGKIRLQTYYNASIFYHAYSSMFNDEVLINANYITHMVPVEKDETQTGLLSTAKELLKKYSNAKYVVTSRIHCALPCLGMGTPVIFVLNDVMNEKHNGFAAPGRFGGLIDLFRISNYKNNSLSTQDPELMRLIKLTPQSSFNNKTDWIPIKEKLIAQIKSFIGNT